MAFQYESMGTRWAVSLWDAIDRAAMRQIEKEITTASQAFDDTYSRFKATSVISELAGKTGTLTVPEELVAMLQMYRQLHKATDGKCNPLVGHTMSDLGYDANYSLQEHTTIRKPPPFDCVRIIDATTIELTKPCLIDLGALGKGFFVDRIASLLRKRGLRHFLVNGSGDVFYSGNGSELRAGLEHPEDSTKVIGVHTMRNGAMCSSAGNRRRWGAHHHIIDPDTLASNSDILATWVLAENAALADGLATCLFMSDPKSLLKVYPFEYCILSSNYQVNYSPGFTAEFF